MPTPENHHPSRRDFLRNTSLAGASLFLPSVPPAAITSSDPGLSPPPLPVPSAGSLHTPLDLSPARWIWYPSGRVLQNTFILFRKPLILKNKPISAKGWIIGESRYQLTINGQRVQWGPAPCDPRWTEADPLDLAGWVKAGENVIGAQVLFYGQGEGTWPIGKPGFIFKLEITFPDGSSQTVVSDQSWQSHLARSWKPGQYKRWYLRALQEEFDARLYPYGWDQPGFQPTQNWRPAMEIAGRADRPAICHGLNEYQFDLQGNVNQTSLRQRAIPMLAEKNIPAAKLTESLWINWKCPPEEYFESLTPDAFAADRSASAREAGPGVWQVSENGGKAAALTFEWQEQIVGWPYFTVEAPAGTIIELMVHEAHQPGGPALLNTHLNSWTRFICREGINQLATFDFESLRWLQLHIRNYTGTVTIRDVGVRRRTFPWPQKPVITCSDPKVQKVLNATLNTLQNSAQETLVDGMGRERQQYSGDGGHQMQAVLQAFGAPRLPARYINTYSQGITLDGFFMDSWPAYDRLARLMERQLNLTEWGPILDHSIGFCFDCYHFYQHTGDKEALAEAFPRMLRFLQYLQELPRTEGILPVENLGVPFVWMDNAEAFAQQRHKQCAFNLYAAAMTEHALPVLCRAFGEAQWAEQATHFGASLREACVKKFWSPPHRVFVDNLPWRAEEKQIRTSDRTLAQAILYNQCPEGLSGPSMQMLATSPPELGLSYPANSIWRFWALAQSGHVVLFLDEIRNRWYPLEAVQRNNTLPEHWGVRPDTRDQWSHCPVGPLLIMYQGIAGITPLEPGFSRCQIRPQLGDLTQLNLQAYTVKGPIAFTAEGAKGKRKLTLRLPPGCEAELVLDEREKVSLSVLGNEKSGLRRYRLGAGQEVSLTLKYS